MKKKRVLLVDDEPGILKSSALLLGRHYRIITASSGMEALETLKLEQIDCILLDIVMPSMNGLEFLKLIRSSGHNLPVIILTGKSCLNYAEQCANLRVSGYVNKPYEAEDLIERIDRIFKPVSMQPEEMASTDLSAVSARSREVIEYIHVNCHRPLTLELVSRELGGCSDYTGKLFKKDMGESFSEYLNKFRVERAKYYINEGGLTLSDIARRAGFGSQQNFFKQFKKYAGVTPGNFGR